ncbi:MAG: threonine synthase, partial [Thermoanaerobaculia bacterium]|nr:threonine synthase [Thermoanaerobaculia bacterium]
MRFESTRGEVAPAPLAEALLSGMAGDGGLWVPDALTPLADALLSRLRGMDPMDAATQVARHLFADDLPVAEIDALVARALDFPIPLAPVDDRTAALELFWGPTLAFKDVGARF